MHNNHETISLFVCSTMGPYAGCMIGYLRNHFSAVKTNNKIKSVLVSWWLKVLNQILKLVWVKQQKECYFSTHKEVLF